MNLLVTYGAGHTGVTGGAELDVRAHRCIRRLVAFSPGNGRAHFEWQSGAEAFSGVRADIAH